MTLPALKSRHIGYYVHNKSGVRYRVWNTTAMIQASGFRQVDTVPCTIYSNANGQAFARPTEEFFDGRFIYAANQTPFRDTKLKEITLKALYSTLKIIQWSCGIGLFIYFIRLGWVMGGR